MAPTPVNAWSGDPEALPFLDLGVWLGTLRQRPMSHSDTSSNPAFRPRLRGVLPLIAVGLMVLPGCFTPRTTERMRVDTMHAVQAGDFPTAIGITNELYESHFDGEPDEAGASPAKGQEVLAKQALLWHMERGLIDHLSGDVLTSNRHLDMAGELVDLRRSKGVVTEVATYVANDTLRDYAGNAFEHTQVDYYRALNRLLQAERGEGVYVPSQLAFTPQVAKPGAKPPVPFTLNATDDVKTADNYDRAINFARRMTINQLQETADAAGGNRYSDDPFARFLAAALTYTPKPGDRSDVNSQFADAMLKRSMQGYTKQAELLGGKQPFIYEVTRRPSLVETFFIRHSRAYDQTSFDERIAQYGLSKDDPRLTTAVLPKGHGMVLVLNHVGFIAHPEVLDIRAVAAQFRGTIQPSPAEAARGHSAHRFALGGVVFWAKGPGADIVNFWVPIPVPGDLIEKAVAPGGAAFMGFAIPVHAKDKPIPQPAMVRVRPAMGGNDITSPMEVLSDLDAFARATLKDEQPGVLAKTLIRAVAKQVAAGQLSREAEQATRSKSNDPQKDKQNADAAKLVGLVTNLFTSTAATLSEVADTRAWTTLPDHIEGALIDLPPGNYTLTLITAYGPVECGGVTVQADRLVVVPIRTFPEPLPPRD